MTDPNDSDDDPELTESFVDLLRRARCGDEEAATLLVKRYEPLVRRLIMLRMGDSRLQAAFDSDDVCQSVMCSFFVRARSGQYDLDSPEQLRRLLATMARHKLGMQVRRHRTSKRDQRRVASGSADEHLLTAAESTPSQVVATKEMVGEVQRRLSDDERRLVGWRREGLEWGEIAERLGITPEAARKKLARALDRVTAELGLDD